jgi:hypothetical protein
MRNTAAFVVALAVSSVVPAAQEQKPVPKDSVRVLAAGCTRGYVFTAGPRNPNEPGSLDIPEGTHLRMNGPKKMMAEIKAHEASMIEITGLMKKGQFRDGVRIGGVRVTPGSAPAGGMQPGPMANTTQIDVEGWRPVAGSCPSR